MISIEIPQRDLDSFEPPFFEQILNGATRTTKKDMNKKILEISKLMTNQIHISDCPNVAG